MNSLNKIVSIFIFASSFFSCVEDELYDASIGQKGNIIQLQLPQIADIALLSDRTRSAASEAELMIHRGFVLIFNNDKFASHSNIVQVDVQNNGTKNIKITIKNNSFFPATSKLVFIFNHDETNEPANFNGITTDNISTYFPMGKKFITAIQKNDPIKGIPMFSSDFAGNSSDGIRTVYRSLAKLQVEIAAGIKVDKIHNFGHENVTFKVKNAATDGIIGFNDINTISYGNQNLDASNPPTEESSFNFKTNLLNETVPDNYTNALFLYEFPHKDKIISPTAVTDEPIDAVKFNTDRITLILKHTDEVEGHVPRYFRIDIIGKDATALKKSYLDIKRNHHYKVKITAVNSSGYTTEEDAYANPSSNIEYEIFDDGGDVTISNGQYAISLDDLLNYDTIRIYSKNDVRLDINNICYILPEEMGGALPTTNSAVFTPGSKIENPEDPTEDMVLVVENDPFGQDGKLTKDRKHLKMKVTGQKGRWQFGFKIKFGNIELGRESITIIKEPTMLDAHPGQVRIKGSKVNTESWQTDFEDFGSRYDAVRDETVIYAGDNVTPAGFIHLDGSSSLGETEDAQPVFEEKLYVGYYDNISDKDSVVGSTKIILAQLAPHYIGRFGKSEKTGANLHVYERVVMEKIEEMPDEYNKDQFKGWDASVAAQEYMHWSSTNIGYADMDLIHNPTIGYLNLVDGLMISKNIIHKFGNNESDIPYAVKLCYLRNDIDGDGKVSPEAGEEINWYLPALNQLLGTWINYNIFGTEPLLPATAPGPYLWSSSEIIPWGVIAKQINAINFLTGQSASLDKTVWGGAKTRCVRDIN